MFRSSITTALATLVLPLMLAGSEAVSDAVGFTRQTVIEGRQTVGVTLNNPVVLSATITANSSDALMLAAVGHDVAAVLSNGNAYYVEIVDGQDQVFVGDRFDVDVAMTRAVGGDIVALAESANNTTALSLADDQLAGYRVNIRRHITLADVFGSGEATTLASATNHKDADQVLLFNRATNNFDTYFLHRDARTGATTWKQLGQIGSADKTVIAPGTGVFVQRATAVESELVLLGSVRDNDFIMPLASGYNLVASPYPVDGTPISLQMNAANGFASAATSEQADKILVFNGTDYDTYFLHQSSAGIGETWRKVGDDTAVYSTSELLSAFNSVFIYKLAADPNFVAQRS